MLLATTNVPTPLHMLAANGQTNLFGRARVYDENTVLVDTISLSHVVEGIYSNTYTPTTEGIYSIVYQFFVDPGLTVPAAFDKVVETLDVNSVRTNVMRILGLVHDNSVVDQQTYNADRQMLSARIRNYDSKANADLAGVTGLLFTWNVVASYTGLNLSNFKITRDP